MRTANTLALHVCLAGGLTGLPAAASVSCFNNLTTVQCFGPTQDLIVDYTTGQASTTNGNFPRAYFQLSGDTASVACGTTGAAKRAVLDGAINAGFNAVFSSFLSAFALNRELTLVMRKDINCTIENLKVKGNGSTVVPPESPCPPGEPCDR